MNNSYLTFLKKYILFIGFLGFSLTGFSQVAELDWVHTFGSPYPDEGTAIARDNSGNIYTTGYYVNYVDADPGPAVQNLPGGTGEHVFLQKLDSNGNYLWALGIGNSSLQRGLSVTTDINDDVIISGYFWGTMDFDPGVGTANLTSNGNRDIFVAKYSKSGQFRWAKSFGSTDIDEGRGVACDNNGNVFLTGKFLYTVDFDPGATVNNLISAGSYDVFVLKLDSAGTYQWAKSFGSTDTDEGHAISVDYGGNVLVTGNFRGTVDFNPGTGVNSLTAPSTWDDIFVLKLDNNGNYLWSNNFGSTSIDKGYAIDTDFSNNVYVTGFFRNTVDFDPSTNTLNIASNGGADVCIIKLKADGSLNWAKAFGGTGSEIATGISVDLDGNVVTGGYYNSTSADFNPGSSSYNLSTNGGYDVFAQKLDSLGNFVWSMSAGNSGEDKANSIVTQLNGDVYLYGFFNDTVDFNQGASNFGLSKTNGDKDMFLLKLGDGQCVPVNASVNISACNDYTWSVTGLTYTSSGSYTDTVAGTNGCDSIITLNLTIHNPTPVTISGLQSNYCANDPIESVSTSPSGGSLFGSGITGTTFDPNIAGVGNHMVYYSYTDGNGCSSNDSMTVTVHSLPTVSLTGIGPFCENDSYVTLTATPSGGAFTGSGVNNNNFSPGNVSAGNHQITYEYTDGNGCSNADSIIAIVNELPSAEAGSDQSTYTGGTVTLSGSASGGTSPYTYLWSPAASVVNSTNAVTLTNALSESTYFDLYVTDVNGCTGYDYVYVTTSGSALSAGPYSDKSVVCAGDKVELYANASGGSSTYTYTWTSLPSGFSSTAANPVDYPSISTSYILSVNDGSSTINDTIFVHVNTAASISFTGNATSFCENDNAVQLSAIPAGGTFSGTGINTNAFEPYTAGIGNHTLKYEVTDGNGCSAVDSLSVQVFGNPSVSITSPTSFDYCQNSDSIQLIGSPVGGTFSGTSIVGHYFHPKNAQLGVNTVDYSYTDGNGCTSGAAIYMNVLSAPAVSITSNLNTSYCDNEASIQLTAYPSGGSFSGIGVSGNTLDFSSGASGSRDVIYSFTQANGCANADTVSTIVYVAPTVQITTSLNAGYCQDALGLTINATPSGGSFSGAISNSAFDPSSLSSGYQEIVYTISDGNGCSNSDTIGTIIYPAANALITSNLNSDYCEDASSVLLTAFPTGGSFGGNGVTGNSFDPSQASIGLNTIVYYYVDGNGCTDNDTLSVNIYSLPTVSHSPLADVCANNNQVNLSGGTPSGGDYSGSFVNSQSNLFYPQTAGAGSYTIDYTYTDLNGCSNTASVIQKVTSVPIAQINNVGPSACVGDTISAVGATQAGPNAIYNWTFDNANTQGSGFGPYDVSWTTTGLKQITLSVTDSNCTSSTTSQYVQVWNSFALITAVGGTNVCYGDSVTLFANTGIAYSYQWYDLNGALPGDTLSYISPKVSGDYYCKVTNPNSCVATSNTIAVTVKPQLIADFSLATTACTNENVNISFTGSATATATYNWDFDNAQIVSGSGQGPITLFWTKDTLRTVSLTLTEGSCSSEKKEYNIQVQKAPVSLTALGNTSFCDGGSVNLLANTGNFNYSWEKDNQTIAGANQAFYNATQTGVYTVNVQDTLTGCSAQSDSVVVTVNTTDFNLAFSANQTSFNIPPFNPLFSNQTSNSGDYYWLWDFGDGNTSTLTNPQHLYAYDGTYTVGVIATNIATGCVDSLTKVDYITCTGGAPNPCSVVATVLAQGLSTICQGDSIVLYADQADTNNTYQWLKDGVLITGATDTMLYASQSGMYQVMVSDGTCTEFSTPFSLSHFPSLIPIVQSNGSIMPCTNDSMELYVTTYFPNYLWSTGATTSSIFVKTSNNYQVTATDINGCQTTSQPFVVNASLLQTQEICIVGVDTNNFNRVIWERNNDPLIDSFRVYREGVIAGQYQLIGTKGANELSILSDTNSNPQVRAYRYYITAVDTCGTETPPSTIHKSIHLTINAGLNGSWNLIWDGYVGFPFGSYRIYRGSSANNMSLLTQLPSTNTSYTDLNPPSGTIYYQIEVVKSSGCYPDSIFSKANTNYNTSRSNIADNGSIAPIFLSADFNANVTTGQWPIQVAFHDVSTGSPTSWRWDFGDGNSSIEQNPKHTYNNTGVYTVKLEVCNQGMCDTIVKHNYINVLPNGMIEVGVKLDAKLYPNPNDGRFTLELNPIQTEKVYLSIYNNIGQLIQSEQFVISDQTLKTIDLSGQSKGVYYVHLGTKDGMMYREKVIVQ